MKAKLIRHFNDIQEQVGDIVMVTSVNESFVFIVVTRSNDQQQYVRAVLHTDISPIDMDECPEMNLRTMIVMMSVSAVVGLLLFVISELIQLRSFIGFMLCMSGYITTFVLLRSAVHTRSH